MSRCVSTVRQGTMQISCSSEPSGACSTSTQPTPTLLGVPAGLSTPRVPKLARRALTAERSVGPACRGHRPHCRGGPVAGRKGAHSAAQRYFRHRERYRDLGREVSRSLRGRGATPQIKSRRSLRWPRTSTIWTGLCSSVSGPRSISMRDGSARRRSGSSARDWSGCSGCSANRAGSDAATSSSYRGTCG